MKVRSQLPPCCWAGWLGTALLVLAGGCSGEGLYPVEGQIVDAHGQPIAELEDGTVEFEALEAPVSAIGDIDEEGYFRMTTKRPGDGAVLGKHRVLIMQPSVAADEPVVQVIDPKYHAYATSGLEVTVEPKRNKIRLPVERAKKGGSPQK